MYGTHYSHAHNEGSARASEASWNETYQVTLWRHICRVLWPLAAPRLPRCKCHVVAQVRRLLSVLVQLQPSMSMVDPNNERFKSRIQARLKMDDVSVVVLGVFS
jgi:hypothetical protein